MAFPSIASSAVKIDAASGTQHDYEFPSGIQAGDLLIWIMGHYPASSGTASNYPSGFNALVSDFVLPDVYMEVFVKVAAGTESGTGQHTSGNSCIAVTRIDRIANWHGTDSSSGRTGLSDVIDASTTINPSALNPSGWDVEDTLWINYLGYSPESAVSSYPSNMGNNQVTNATGSGTGHFRMARASAESAVASFDPATWTVGTAAQIVSLHLVIRPKVVSYNMEGFLWRDDNDDEDAATALTSQDTNISRGKNVNTRLRILTDTVDADPPTGALTLQYRKVGDPASEWRTIPV